MGQYPALSSLPARPQACCSVLSFWESSSLTSGVYPAYSFVFLFFA